MTRAWVLLPALLILGACTTAESDGDDERVGQQEQEGRRMNGRRMNGRQMNGDSMNGRRMNGVALNGSTFQSVTLEGTSLVATGTDGVRMSGLDFRGAELQGAAPDGTALTMRIDAVERHATQSDILLYTASLREGTSWVPLCGLDERLAPIPAIPLAGRWDYREGVPGGGAKIDDPDAITFACRGFALAKCAEDVGYRPWAGLATHHQACVRLVRSDYCGDGRSFTQDGNVVNIVDNIGIQRDTELWLTEAEWTPNGARCLTKSRYLGLSALGAGSLVDVGGLPPCLLGLVSLTCGARSHFTSGSVLMSEVPVKLSISLF